MDPDPGKFLSISEPNLNQDPDNKYSIMGLVTVFEGKPFAVLYKCTKLGFLSVNLGL